MVPAITFRLTAKHIELKDLALHLLAQQVESGAFIRFVLAHFLDNFDKIFKVFHQINFTVNCSVGEQSMVELVGEPSENFKRAPRLMSPVRQVYRPNVHLATTAQLSAAICSFVVLLGPDLKT